MSDNFIDNVWNDIKSFFLIERQDYFYNERDLQVSLALYFEKGKKYDHVYLEYYVPVFDNNKKKILDKYPWNSEIKMDIVVCKKGLYVPIELKYKTTRINACSVTRFGESIENVDIIKKQSAQDIGRYNYWKDIKRIEVVKERYEKVIGGIALFLTNDPNYYKETKGYPSYYNFRLSKDNDGSKMSWLNEPKIKKDYPDFVLECEYLPQWLKEEDTKLPNGTRCFYCLIK